MLFKTQKLFMLYALTVFCSSQNPAYASDSSTKYSFTIGSMVFSDFSNSGDSEFQGASYAMPLSFAIRQSEFRWRISTAYLTQVQDDVTYSGAGDTSLSLSYRLNNSFDVSYRHKFATGDEDLGFSSGEDDDAIGLDYFHILNNQLSLFSTLGYKWVGEGDRTDRQNAANVSVGLGYIISPDFSLMSSVDYNQSSYISSDDVKSITLMGSHKIIRAVKIGWFVSGDNTETYSAGTNLVYSF